MKFFVILSVCLVLANAQRPSYASSGPIGRPGLANRFKDDTTSTSKSTSVTFENRDGESGTSSTPKIPVDARGDVDLVNTLNSWNREHQPFWFINADHIEKARNTTRGAQQTTQSSNIQTANRNQVDSQGNQDNFLGNAQGQSFSNQQGFTGSQGSGNQDRLFESGVGEQSGQSQTGNRNGILVTSDRENSGYAASQNEFTNRNFRRPSQGSFQTQRIPQRYPYDRQDFDNERQFAPNRQSRFRSNIHYFF